MAHSQPCIPTSFRRCGLRTRVLGLREEIDMVRRLIAAGFERETHGSAARFADLAVSGGVSGMREQKALARPV